MKSSLRKLSEPVGLAAAVALSVVVAQSCAAPEDALRTTPLDYPETRRGDVVDDYHGTRVADPYRWLEAIDSEETLAWVESQNAVSQPYLENLPARDHFVTRLEELDAIPNPGASRRQGGAWITRQRTSDGGFELVIRDELDGPPRHRVDSAAFGLSGDEELASYRLSPDGRRLAFVVNEGGSEFLELRVLDLETGDFLDDVIRNLKFHMPFWTADGEHLVYWRYLNADTEKRLEVARGGQVALHRLGTAPEADRELARTATEDPGTTLWSEVSTDGRFVVLFEGDGNAQKVSVVDLGDSAAPNASAPAVELIGERRGDHGFVGNLGSTLYFLTTLDAPLGRIVAVDLARPTGQQTQKQIQWQTVIPEDEHLLESALVVGGRIVVAYRRDVQSALVVFGTDGRRIREVPLPGPGSTFLYAGSPEADDLVFGFDGMTVPVRRIHHDVASGATKTLDERRIPGLDVGDYVSRQIFFTSKDGTRVPMFVAHRKDLERSGRAPTILNGYGARGTVMEPIFRDDFYAWMEAGGVIAIAGIRGGGEYGKAWTEAGRLERKQNTFDDFIAAAESLIAEGYTSPEHLSILGYSNGGLLVGAVMTQRPDLFAVALPIVGVLDALRFPTTTVGPFWAHHHGDARIPEQFPWVYAWSPLHHVEDGVCYPATLVMTAANDDQANPSQSFKFAARLQAAQGCERPVVLRVAASGGHGFYGGNHVATAEMLAFAARHTGLVIQAPAE